MFDAQLHGVMQRYLVRPARWCRQAGLQADQLSMAGFALGLLAVPMLAFEAYLPALVLILANRLFDGLDGALAREIGPTDRGAFLDIALDFAFYGLVVFGFALADPEQNALAAAFLLMAFIGTGSSFLAFALIAGRLGLPNPEFPRKGIHYVGGLTEGAETIAVFVLMCLWPGIFPWLALIFGLACCITTGLRWQMGWQAFAGRATRAG